MYKLIFALLLLTVLVSPIYSQKGSTPDGGKPKIINPEGKTPFPYKHSIDAGIADRSGNLWFGTTDGIYRYDGKLFTSYQIMDGLHVDHVSRMMQDKEGNIWFGASGGVVRFDPSAALVPGASSFRSIKIPATNLSDLLTDTKAFDPKNRVTQMIEDRKGNIWFSIGYNVYRSDGRSGAAIMTSVGEFLKSEKVAYHCMYPDDFGICGIYEDKQGNILISTMACSCGPSVSYRLDGSRVDNPCVMNRCKHDLRDQQQHEEHTREIAASFSKISNEDGNTKIAFSTVLEDRSGTVWVGTDSGVYKYDGSRFTHFTKGDLLSKSVISTIYEDKKGYIWFGTNENEHTDNNGFAGNGVFRYDPSAPAGTASITQYTTRDGLCNSGSFKNNTVSSITEDNTGRVWFAGSGGACYFNGVGFTSLTKTEGFTDHPVNCMVKDKTGNLWFGSWELGLYRYDGKSLICLTESKPGL